MVNPISVALFAGLLTFLPARAQTPQDLTIAQAAERSGPQFIPTRLGALVRVTGVLAGRPVPQRRECLTVLQAPDGSGLAVSGACNLLTKHPAGTLLRVTGRLNMQSGLPVLNPDSFELLGEGPPPAPQPVSIEGILRPDAVGRFVQFQGQVIESALRHYGEVLVVSGGSRSLPVVLPSANPRNATWSFRPGDRVRVSGISGQFSPSAPFDQGFEVLVPSSASVELLERASVVTPAAVLAIFITGGLMLAIWWLRERKLSRQRETLRGIMRLTESVTSALSPLETAQRLEAVPEEVFGTTEIALYLHLGEKDTLERVLTQPGRPAESIPVNLPSGSVPALIVAAFRNRTMLAIPNVSSSPFADPQQPGLPESAVLVPMVAQGEVMGVLALLYRRRADLNPGFLAAVQHLANQAGSALRLQGQQLMKEQLLRSEKMAAAGQMLSAVADGLREPLLNISRASSQLLSRGDETTGAELREIFGEAERGLELVAQLLSFSGMERREPRVFDACTLVLRILESRSADHERLGIRVEQRVTEVSTEILADPAQMKHALLSALVTAERAAAASPERLLVVGCSVAGSRTQVSFETRLGDESEGVEIHGGGASDVFGFPVAQAILQSHGGDLRQVTREAGQFRIEADIPLHAPSATTGDVTRRAERPARVITALIVEPDLASQRRLVSLLSARGHRAIPVTAADEASDIAQRIAFDILFCSADVQGLTWVELFQRVRRRVGIFTLLTDGVDPASIQAFSGGEGHVLAKPVEERDLDHILGIVEVRWAVSRR